MRRTDGCRNCAEVREIAAYGLCFACYRKNERARDRQAADVDRHSPGIRREHKKLFRGFTSVMTGLSDLAAQKKDVLTIRRMLEPYVAPIAEFLGPSAEEGEVDEPVNGEHEQRSCSPFTRGGPSREEEPT
jgi:hypothetical protein